MDDPELSEIFQEWKAPDAPPTLRDRVLPRRQSWWRWLLTGTIRVPVPVGVVAVLARRCGCTREARARRSRFRKCRRHRP